MRRRASAETPKTRRYSSSVWYLCLLFLVYLVHGYLGFDLWRGIRKMRKHLIIFSTFVLAYCGAGEDMTPIPSDEHENHEHEADEPERASLSPTVDEHEGEEHEDLHVSLENQREWGIKLGEVVAHDLSSRIRVPGTLTLNQNRTAHISSLIHGQISFLSVDLGDNVKTGRTLLTLNSPEFAQTQADFLEARARMNLSRREYDRAKMLLKENAIEEKEYYRREAEYQQSSAEYGALGSQLHSVGITHDQIDELIRKCESMEDEEYKCEIANPNLPVLSPLTGTVIFRDAVAGDHIEPEKTLFTVSNLDTQWAILDAYEKDIPFISKKSSVTIESPLYPERGFPGRITYISDTIDEKLRTVKIRVEVDNIDRLLKPNMYIQGIVENSADGRKLAAVPEEAVQNLNGEKIVFVPEEEEVFTVRHVQLGDKVGNSRIIIAGLELGEILVIEGAFTLKTELSKGTSGAAHVH